ncbi:hypothetical protein MTR67_003271 [Solanum verrucosum]|uniref:Uncharacterized protein n=1 Tax=Solanum verrucosum TaxID=315347 RepID=A0AAF0PSD9_SOLVR|nr:hypothetical protein MTR67_003271 [Solanum verrucosum]
MDRHWIYAPYLESSQIRYWNPRSINLRINSTANVHRGSTLCQISLICLAC